jgi:protein involved in polysaccharide export with SLBB domain
MNIKKLTLFLFLISTGIILTNQSQAQTFNTQNLSNVRVDELTDDQIRNFIKQVESSGLPESQLENMALAKGMQPSEIGKLRARVDALRSKSSATGSSDATVKGKDGSVQRSFEGQVETIATSDGKKTEQESDIAVQSLKSKIFGRELFSNAATTFEPNLRLPTPLNYVLGTGDQLQVDIYGYSEVNYSLTISPDGTVNIPNIGVTPLAGLTIEAATARIKSKLSTIYSALNTGQTKLSVTLGNIRSIRVILNGEVMKPGTYTLPSLATVFTALYSSGGPSDNGSFRNVEVIRNGKKVAVLDVYDFILNGDLKGNIALKDQDIINIPVYQKRVEIVGEVKRPAIFELKPKEDLNKLLEFASGFTEKAYKARIKVLKNTDTERKISDVTADQYDTYIPESGDKYFVNEILDRFENRVTIEGAIFRPGQYELTAGLTVKELILKAEGLKEDAFKNRAYITRLTADLNTELISIDLNKIMNGQERDIVLKREDVLSISSIFDLREEYTLYIDGAVRAPGKYPFSENMSLEELIIKAGGFTESAIGKRIEISRRINNAEEESISSSAKTAEIFQIDLDKGLTIDNSKFVLKPFDLVIIRESPGYEKQRVVRILGEVVYPGVYVITRKDERISDLVKRAGGLTAQAFTDGASLKRNRSFDTELEREKEQQKIQQFQKIQKNSKDTTALNLENLAIRNSFVGISLTRILDKPRSKQDLFLENEDILNIPKELQTVKVSGEVLSPNTVVYNKNKTFKSYVLSAGGFGEGAKKGRSYIIYANGAVKATKKFLIFNNYPVVKTGAEIFVPKNAESRKLTPAETAGIISGLASLGAIVLGVINFIK